MQGKLDITSYKQQLSYLKTEEDVRAETNSFLQDICRDFNIDIRDRGHEITSAFGGRADSIYSDVIIEYKSPKINLSNNTGYQEVLYGRDDKDHGLFHYLVNFSLEGAHNDDEFVANLKNKVGVGFNSKTFVFARFVASDENINLFCKRKSKEFPSNISKTQKLSFIVDTISDLELGFKKLLLFLRSTSRKRLSSKSILELFGPNSTFCQESVCSIHKSLLQNISENNLRVITLYNEWERIFGDVYGDKETDFTAIKDSLFSLYNIKTGEEDIKSILFSIQTYYNIILKLLVFSLLNCLRDPTFTSGKYTRKLDIYQIFTGKLLNGNYSIQNFFEVQFFEWFLYAKDFDIEIIQNTMTSLDSIEATASVIKPEIVEDVFREVYNGLMPKSVRHLLGEYYTPGWLVDFVLDKANYTGDVNKSLLDPACGSGSFVTHAIKRHLEKNKEIFEKAEDLIKNITTHIVGYDINPITVITAKTNYILALGDITSITSPINIPIYMCDSVLVPTVHAKQNQASHAIKINTIAGEFEIPVFNTRDSSDIFMREVSSHVENYTFDEFISYLSENSILSLENVNLDIARSFYEKIGELHLTSQDGFWGIILKNSFAPLFSKGGFDIVVGNPPWISWKAMSDTYRKQTLDIWLSYGIFEKNAYDKKTTHDDFAMAVTYVSLDHYCKEGGELVFVLPQTFLKASKGGEGFRKFCITRDGLDIPFAITDVWDMLKISPFKGVANNKSSVIKFKKNMKMTYPMDNYWECIPVSGESLNYTDTYSTAIKKFTCSQLQAQPINEMDPRSPWLTMPKNDLDSLKKYLGKSPYRGRKGIEPCGAKGVYLLDVMPYSENLVTIKNLVERSSLRKVIELGVHEGIVEKEMVYPMIGGRNIQKWGITSHLYMLVPHNNSGDGIYRGVPESTLKIKYPKTYEWLLYFHDVLLETRIRSGKFFKENLFPFYRLDNVGPYTFMPYHVVWREQNKKMVACVVSTINTESLGEKIVVTDSKVLFCPFEDADEAYYLCGIINSSHITKIIEAYTIDTQRGVDILHNICIPKYNPSSSIHQMLAKLSKKAHDCKINGCNLSKIESDIDDYVTQLFE